MEISVIIPTYNEQKHISKCINSLLNQDYSNLEIIVVDDGSMDRSTDLIEGYVKKYDTITLIKQKHKGPGAARNKGSEIARGEIFVFIDADMEFEPNYVTELTKPILFGEVLGTYHGYEHLANENNPIAICGRRIQNPIPQTVVFRAIKKEEFLNVGGFDPRKKYADDITLYDKLRVLPLRVDTAICYHHNPETFKEVFDHAIMIGKSPLLPSRMIFLNFISLFFITLPFLAIRKSLIHKSWKILFVFPFYYYVYSFGIVIGTLKRKFRKQG